MGTDALGASIDVTYTLTGDDFTQATTADGLKLENEEVQWRDWGPKKDKLIADRDYSVTLKAPAGATAPLIVTVVIQFPTTIRNDDWKDPRNNTVFHQAWLKDDPEQRTARIDLTSVAANPGNQGGRNPGVPLRLTSPQVSVAEVGLLLPPALPVIGSAGYRLLAYDSPNGTDYTFTTANSSGTGLFVASSPTLVQNDNGDWVLDPATTLNPVYPDGSQTAGAYNGSNNNLVLRASSNGQAGLLAGYAYSAVPASLLTVPDGESVTIAPEDLGDGDDMLWLNYEDGDATRGFVMVPADSSDPQLTASDLSVTEGNSGTTNATFTVSLSAASASTVTVNYGTLSGTATAGSDFTAASGTLTFAPGETSKTVTVAVTGDTTFEPNEDFFLTLSSAANAVIADGVAGATIQNDDAQPTVSINNVSQPVGDSGTTQFVFTVTLSNPSWQTITVDFATADGSATAGTDYEAASGTLTFQPGQTSQTITITVYRHPGASGEYFYVNNLSNPTDASFLDNQGMGLGIGQE